MRDSTIFYRSFYDAIKGLPAEQQVDCFHAIMEYALDGKEPEGDGIEKTVFTLVRPQIDTNNQRYENGTKGGRPREKAECRQETAKEKPIVNQVETKREPKQNQEITKEKPKNNQEETKPEPKENQSGTKSEPRNNQTETKQEPNVNVNDNVNENVNVNDKTKREDARVCARTREGHNAGTVTEIPDNGKLAGKGAKTSEAETQRRGIQFQTFWGVYPRKVEKQMAQQEYLSLLMSTPGLEEDRLVRAAQNYAEACQIRQTEERFVKHPANWLSDGVWMDYLSETYQKPNIESKPRKQAGNQFLAFPQREYSQEEYQSLEQRLLEQSLLKQAGDG